ncbi:MAG: hypothetical protein ACI4GD_04155 [Lachnospiraceae bacterium]
MGTNLLYYIMDYSSHYYRTNREDQLVVASCPDEATVFTFAQANARISGGKKSGFYCMIPVDENECVNEDEIEVVKETSEKSEKSEYAYDLSEIDWEEYLTHFSYIGSQINNYRDELAEKHSEIDQKISDILHYIELCETNDDEAVDLVEQLRTCREKRREIKDELSRIEYFQNNLGTSANVAKAQQALKLIKGLEKRQYKPRVYTELFDNCTMRHKKYEEKMIEQDNRSEGADEIMESGKEVMVKERLKTPFDGRNNNWLDFARQQAGFYRNAGQYITNLLLDIENIDREIEETLKSMEDLNCNVAQGYKVFRKLKDLRLERKMKTKELDCLYALTDYIDCPAFADICEESLTELERITETIDTDNLEMDSHMAG